MPDQTLVDFVDQLFDQASDRNEATRINPVTQGEWVPKRDSIRLQKTLARGALAARINFMMVGPSACQPLPITREELEAYKGAFDEKYIVSLFARSLASRGYRINGHPKFAEYAAGILALPSIGPQILSRHPELAERYPPRTLLGLTDAGHFRN